MGMEGLDVRVAVGRNAILNGVNVSRRPELWVETPS